MNVPVNLSAVTLFPFKKKKNKNKKSSLKTDVR